VQQYCDWVEVNWGVKKKSNQNILKLNQIEFKKSDNFEEKNESNHFLKLIWFELNHFHKVVWFNFVKTKSCMCIRSRWLTKLEGTKLKKN